MPDEKQNSGQLQAIGFDQRRIIHVDMDAFFASVEQRDNPDLRGRPVAVGRGKLRGVVAAASYEARKFGVRSAMPSVRAMRACPELIFVLPRFERYREVSAQIHEIFHDYTDLVEPLSLDEAYLDVTQLCARGTTATAVAEEIRERIWRKTRLTASAGVSCNKFLAKLASDQNKPDGLTVIRPSYAEDYVASLPVGRFHGIGPVMEGKMHGLGIEWGADLQALDMAQLTEFFGTSAEHFYNISRGVDHRPVQPHRERKSIGAENTFESDLSDLAPAIDALVPISEKVAQRAMEKGCVGHTLTLKIKFADFEQITRQKTLSAPISQVDEIRRLGAALLQEQFPFRLPIRLLGLSLSALEQPNDKEDPQLSLFDL